MRIRARVFSLVVALLLLAPSAFAADFYFVGDTDADWNDGTNWSATSGGAGGAGVPGSNDAAIFDVNSPDCELDANIEVAGLKLEADYSGVLDASDSSIAVNYDSGNGFVLIAGGWLELGSGTHTISGSWTFTGGVVSAGTSKVQFYAPNAASIDIDGDFSLNDVRFYHSGSGSSHKTVNVSGTVTINGGLELEGYGSGGWHMYLSGGGELVAKGDVTGNGKVIRGNVSLTVSGSAGDQTQMDLWWGTSGTYTVNKSEGTLFWSGTEKFGDYTTGGNSSVTLALTSCVDAVTDSPSVWLCGYGHGDVTVQGDLTVHDLKFYRPGGTGHTTYDLSEGTITVENTLTLDLSASGGWHVYIDNGTLAAKGDVTFANNDADWWGSALIKMTGPDAATLTGGGLATKALSVEVTKSDHAVVSLGGNLSLTHAGNADLTVASGALDLAGYDLTVGGTLDVNDTLRLKGNETITGTVDLDQTTSTVVYHDSSVAASVNSLAASFCNLRLGAGKTHNFTAGQRVTIKGSFGSEGTSASKAVLRSTTDGTAWELDVQGNARLLYVDAKDSDASPGSQVLAYDSTDSGNNTNWSFGAAPLYTWTGQGADNNWSTTGNWAQSTVPGPANTALFNGTSVKKCVLDGNIDVTGLKLEAGHTGIVDANDYAIQVNYGTGSGILSVADGRLKLASATHTIKGSFSYTGGVIDAGTSKVQFYGPNAASIDVDGDFSLNDVRFYHANSGSSHKTVNLTGMLTVNGDLELEGYGSGGWHMYLSGGGELVAKGDVTGNGKVIRGNVSLTVSGSAGDQTQTDLWWGTSGTYTVNKAAGTLVWSGTTKLGDPTTGGSSNVSMVLTSAVDAVTNTPTVWLCGYGHGDLTLQGNLTAYDVKLYRTGGTGHTTYDFSGGTVTGENSLTLDVAASGGWHVYINNGTLDTKGNLTFANNNDDWWGTALVKMSGPDTATLTGGGLATKAVSIEVAKSDGAAVTLAGELSLDYDANDALTITSGLLDLAGYDINVGDLTVGSSGMLRLHGDEAITRDSLTLSEGCTVDYGGSGTYGSLLLGSAYSNVKFSGSGTYTLAGDLDVNQDITLANGTLNDGGKAVYLAGNWVQCGGSLSATGSVVLDGADQLINGSTAFNNLTKTATAAQVLTFEADTTQTVQGALTLQGSTGQLLALRSRTPGQQWKVDPRGSRAIAYLSVRDSRNVNPRPIDARNTNSQSLGNNLYWIFWDAPVGTWTGLGSDNNWSTAANWAQQVIPGAGHVALFNSTSAKNCLLDTQVAVRGIKLEAPYAGVLDAATYAITIDYASGDGILLVAGGELKLGSGTHTVKGNFSYTGGTITPGTGKVQFYAPNAASIDIDGDFGLNDVRFYHSGSGSSHKKVNLNGTLTVSGDLELEGYGSGGWHFYLNGEGTLLAKGDITGNSKVIRGDANLSIAGDSGDQTQTDLCWGTSGTYTVDKASGTLVLAGTEKLGDWTSNSDTKVVLTSAVDATTNSPEVWLCGRGHGDVTLQGDVTVYDLKFYRPGGTGHTTYDLGGGTITVNNTLTLDMSATGGWKVYGQNGTLECKGGIVTTNNQVTDWSGMSLVLSGTVAQSADLEDLSIASLTVENTSATVTLSSGFTAADTIGASAGASIVFANGESFSCAKLAFDGTTSSSITLRSDSAGTAWLLNVGEPYQTASCVDVKDSDASGGELVYAVESTDSGNNTNWSFLDRIKVNITTANSSATSPAWVQGEVGPNVTEVKVKVNSGTAFDAERPSRMRFFADNTTSPLGITLSATSTTQVDVTAKDDLANEDTATQYITWTATDLAGSDPSTVIKIRKGDSLLLTASDSEGGGTTLEIDADGDDTYDYSGAPDDEFAHQYNTAGSFVAKAKIDGEVVGSITVVVISIDLQGPVPAQVNYQRTKGILVTPAGEAGNITYAGEFSSADPTNELEVSLKQTTQDGADLYVKPLKRCAPVIYARLGADGPIIARQEVDEFTMKVYPRSKLLINVTTREGTSRFTMRPFTPDLRVKFNMFGSQSTFEDGVTQFSALTSTDFTQIYDEDTGETIAIFDYIIVTPVGEDTACYTANPEEEETTAQVGDSGCINPVVDEFYLEFAIPDNTYNEGENPAAGPVATDLLRMSDPRPTVTLDSHEVTITGGNAVVKLSGLVGDSIADNIPRGHGADIDQVEVYVDGGEEYDEYAILQNKTEDKKKAFWRQYPYRGKFASLSTTVPLVEGMHTVRVQTSPNVAGNTGFRELGVKLIKQQIPGTAPGTGNTFLVNIYMPVEPSYAVTDYVQLYYGNRGQQQGDPILTERGIDVRFALTWGVAGTGNGQFDSPSDAVVDNSGNVYVVDTANDRVQKFDKDGTFLLTWGSSGTGDGQFSQPKGVGVDSSGNVYVADTGNHRIQKFSSTGVFAMKFGTQGAGDGQLQAPTDVAVDSSGNIFVVDQGNNRIQKFTSAGAYAAKWGAQGSGSGQFNTPSGIAVDSADNLYISDTGNDRIQKFNGSGSFLAKWGDSGTEPGSFANPTGLAVDSRDRVHVCDSGNNRSQLFDASGTFLKSWGSAGSEEGEFDFAASAGIAVAEKGRVYVVDSGNDRIQKFLMSETALLVRNIWGSAGSEEGQFDEPADVVLDGAGHVYVLDSGNSRVQKFSPSGGLLLTWGTAGSADGQFNAPKGIGVDAAGCVYVADTGNNRVQKFDPSGTFVLAFGSQGTGDGQFDAPVDVAVSGDGHIYVVDEGNDRVQKFTSGGTFVGKWGGQGTGDGQFDSPRSVAVDTGGNVYVTDSGNDRIQKFDSSGAYLLKWGSTGVDSGEFNGPGAIAIDSAGRVYVCDTGNHRVQRFDSTGAFQMTSGSQGDGKGEFDFAIGAGVAVDDKGRVLVTDASNNRVQEFVVSEASLVFEGLVSGVPTTVTISPETFHGLTGQVDSFDAAVVYAHDDDSTMEFSATFVETSTGSNVFRHSFTVEGGDQGEPVEWWTTNIEDRGGSTKYAYRPITLRTKDLEGDPNAYVITVEGVPLPLQEIDGWWYIKGQKSIVLVLPDPTDPKDYVRLLIYVPPKGEQAARIEIKRVKRADPEKPISIKAFLQDAGLVRVLAAAKAEVQRSPIAILWRNAKKTVTAFETLEFEIWVSPLAPAASGKNPDNGLNTGKLTPSQMFNAYDTSRGFIQVAVVVSSTPLGAAEIENTFKAYEGIPDHGTEDPKNYSVFSGTKFVVPAFYCRDNPGDPVKEPLAGAWRWRARIGLVSGGKKYHFYACARVKPKDEADLRFPKADYPAGVAADAKWTHQNYPFSKYPAGASAGLDVKKPITASGPMKSDGRYFKKVVYRAKKSSEEKFFGLGNARPWNMKKSDVEAEGDARWDSAFIPFSKQMNDLRTLGEEKRKDTAGNLFSWWLVAWDSNPVHGMDAGKYKEYWDEDKTGKAERGDGAYTPKDITIDLTDLGSKPYRYFDQGRCKKTDRLLDAAEANSIYVMLTLWPHPELRDYGSGWDTYGTEERYGPKHKERWGLWRDGAPNGGTESGYSSGWTSFGAPANLADNFGDPHWKYQRNFYRYVVARWGCRRGLGLYEFISEIGGTSGVAATEQAWRKEARTFIRNISPYKQGISTAPHTVDAASITDDDADYVNSHGYSSVTDGLRLPAGGPQARRVRRCSMNNDEIKAENWILGPPAKWEATNGSCGGLIKDNDRYRREVLTKHSAFYKNKGKAAKPLFCGEVGASLRRPGQKKDDGLVWPTSKDRDLPLTITAAGGKGQENVIFANEKNVEWRYQKGVSTFHYTVWSSLLCGGSAAPLAWCDGKEFGEMIARPGNAAGGKDRFGKTKYEINYYEELKACKAVVDKITPASLAGMTTRSCLKNVGSLNMFVLKDPGNTKALVWLVLKSRAKMVKDVNLKNHVWGGNSKVEWINPWTGAVIAGPSPLNLDNDVETKIEDVAHKRPLAGKGDKTGPHEKEDILLWITK